jgi:hypothetical protein
MIVPARMTDNREQAPSGQPIKWTLVYESLQTLFDQPGESYFSGPRFMKSLRRFAPDLPSYYPFLEERRVENKSTARRDYFRDILEQLDESVRIDAVSALLDELQEVEGNGERVSNIRARLAGRAQAPTATIPSETWNAERLNSYLGEIDKAIQKREYERAVTLSYTCLEGFLGAFLRKKVTATSYPTEIIELSKRVREYLRATIKNYPDELINVINHTAHAVDKSRNRFSESHFADEAESWMATYVRDLVNSEIRLLLHFM